MSQPVSLLIWTRRAYDVKVGFSKPSSDGPSRETGMRTRRVFPTFWQLIKNSFPMEEMTREFGVISRSLAVILNDSKRNTHCRRLFKELEQHQAPDLFEE